MPRRGSLCHMRGRGCAGWPDEPCVAHVGVALGLDRLSAFRALDVGGLLQGTHRAGSLIVVIVESVTENVDKGKISTCSSGPIQGLIVLA